MDNVYVIKVKHEGSLRRITALKSTDGALLPFSELEGRVRALFKLPASADVVLTYQDEEGDVITLATDQDLKDALVYQGLNPLRLDLAVNAAATAAATAAAAYAATAAPSTPSPAPVSAAPVASPAAASAPSPAADAGRKDKAEKIAPPTATPETGVFKDDAAPRPSQPAASGTTTAGAATTGMPKLMSIINKELEQVLGSLGSDFHVDVDFDGPAGSTTTFSSSSSSSSSVSDSDGAAAGAGHAAPSGVGVAGVPPMHKVVHVASAIENVGGLAGIIAKEVEAALKSIDLGSAGQQGPSISTSFSAFPSSSSSSSVGASSGEAKEGVSSSAADAGFGGFADLIKTIASTAAQTAAVAASVQAASDAAAKAASAASGASAAVSASGAASPAGAAPCPTPAAPVRHVGIICDGCDMNPIVGPRFKSLVKEDYDLCEACFAKSGEAADTYARMDRPQLPFPPFHHHHHHHAHHAAMHGHPHPYPHHPMHHGPAFRSPSFAHFGPRRMCPRPPSPVFFGGRPFNMRPDHHHHVQHPARCDSSPSPAPSAPAAPGSTAAGGPSLSNHGLGCTAAACAATSPGSAGAGGRAGKLDARFVRDVSVADGSQVVAGSRFCKVWRMRNSGAAAWPQDTRIVHFGGDMLGVTGSAALDLPEGGLPVDAEVDVRVDMVAPVEPGRYVTHWKLSAPGGLMFGHRVWALVHVVPLTSVSEAKSAEVAAAVLSAPKIVEIEVTEGDVAASASEASAALQAATEVESPVDPLVAVIMAAAPPASVTEEGGDDDFASDELEAAASSPADSDPPAAAVEAPATPVLEAVPAPAATPGGVATAAGAGSPGSPKVEDTTVGSFSLVDMPSAASAAPTGGPATSSPAVEVTAVDSFVMADAAPADAAAAAAAAARRVIVGDADEEDEEEVEEDEEEDEEEEGEEDEDADEEMEMVEVPVQPDAVPATPATAATMSGTPSAPPRSEGSDVVLDQLEAMGFVGRDLNRELLAKTGGNLDATVELLVKAAEWEPVLEELEDMGFMDAQLNKRLLFKNDGNVRRTVKDLVQMCRSGAVLSA